MFNLLSQLSRILAVLIFCMTLTTGTIVHAAPVSPDLSAAVLQVIQDHPKVILDTLISYQQGLDKARAVAKAEVLSNYQKNPASLIQDSPILAGKTSHKIGNHSRQRYIVEFSDFQCPYCQAAHQAIKEIHQQNPNVTIVYKHFPLVQIHDQAMPAAQAAWAASQQGKFWEYHDQLFAQQDHLNDATFITIAQNLGLNLEQFNHDRTSQAAIAAITTDLKVADRLDVAGTPLFVVIGKKSAEVISGGDFDALKLALARV